MAPYGLYGAAAGADPYDPAASPFSPEDLSSAMIAQPDWNPPAQAPPGEAMRARILRLMEGAGGSAASPRSLMGTPMPRPTWANGQDAVYGQPEYANDPGAQVPGGRGPSGYLDRLAGNLADINVPTPNARASHFEQFLQSLVGHAAKSWGQNRTHDVNERTAKQDALERRAAQQNERNAAASADAREARITALKASSAAEKKARAEREGWVTVPGWVANGMGDATLVGKQVPPEKYRAMLATAQAVKPKADAGPDRAGVRQLSNQFRNADTRIGSLRNRIAAIEAGGIPLGPINTEAPTQTFLRYQKLQDALVEQEDAARSAWRGLRDMGASVPSGSTWTPDATDAPPAKKPATSATGAKRAAPNPGAAKAAPVAAPAKPAAAPQVADMMRSKGYATRAQVDDYLSAVSADGKQTNRQALESKGINVAQVLRLFP